mmetsp:Transcript_38340/g.151558  ORF Transcript_38340/g.151558 Transcript_38340/m.151558 type:complete len:132 (-) Transcript_38340:202-597(-)
MLISYHPWKGYHREFSEHLPESESCKSLSGDLLASCFHRPIAVGDQQTPGVGYFETVLIVNGVSITLPCQKGSPTIEYRAGDAVFALWVFLECPALTLLPIETSETGMQSSVGCTQTGLMCPSEVLQKRYH